MPVILPQHKQPAS
jgi:hypothetical protein